MTQFDSSADDFRLVTSADLAVPTSVADGSEEFAVSQQLSAFLDENAAFWSMQAEPRQPAGDGVILTDLMVRQVPYYFGNITVAKYLQLIGGGRLIGLLPVAAPACYRLMRIAESYGFEGFHAEPSGSQSIRRHPELAELLRAFAVASPADLRQRLLDVSIQGIRVGHLIYDSYMRWSARGTVSSLDQELSVHIALAYEYFDFYSRLFELHDVASIVIGHTAYVRFGILLRLALSRGIPVYVRTFNRPVAITRYGNLRDGDTDPVRYAGEIFDRHYSQINDEALSAARDYMRRRTSQTNAPSHLENIASAHGTDRILLNREELHAHLGLSPSRPTAAIMAHVLTDSPHRMNWSLYADYYQWLLGTLETIKDLPEVNWIVRLHPDRSYYGETGDNDLCRVALDRYCAQYSHIFDLDDSYATGSLFGNVDVAVTVDGTAGFEFPAMGIPCIIAGEARYSGNGFTIEPQSIAAYQAALMAVPALEPLPQDQIDRALIFANIFYFASREDCLFLPHVPNGHWVEYDEDGIFAALRSALATNRLEEDPLFDALRRQHAEGHRYLGRAMLAL